MNTVNIIGRLTKNPEIKYLQSGTPACSFTLAVDRSFKSKAGERGTDFIPIVTWGKTAELCEQYLSKGSQIGIVGRIQTRNYEAKDGTKRYITEVVGEEIQFISTTKKTAENAIDGFEEIEDTPF